MPRRDRHGEAQVRKLLDQAKREQAQPGRQEAALRRLEEAAELIRALAARYPDDPRHQQQLASTLYSLASMRTQAGQPACPPAPGARRGGRGGRRSWGG